MVRPLSKDLQKIANEELHENAERVEEDMKHLQEWIKQQPHLNAPIDKQWILGFLRGCKFSLEKTKEKFDMYYTLKTLIPELMKPRDIYSTEIQAILKAGITLPLPYVENHKGPRIILLRYHNYDPDIMNLENLMAMLNMIINILLVEDDNFVISGVLLWFDVSRLPFSILFQCTPTLLKNYFGCLQKGFPIRIKGMHGSGSFVLAEKMLMLTKGFFGSKLKKRVVIYSESNFENLLQVIPKNYMPEEYGGKNSNVEEIKNYWINKVESYSTWFSEQNQYGTIEAKRPGKPASWDDVEGISGSFRKLHID